MHSPEEYENQLKMAEKLSGEVIKLARSTLLVRLRFLDSALYQMKPEKSKNQGFSTDANRFYYNIGAVISAYKQGKEIMPRVYLHSLMHCIFRHMFVGASINRPVWDLACDIAVENAINDLNLDSVMPDGMGTQIQAIQALKCDLPKLTAEKIYRYYLNKNLSDDEIKEIRSLYRLDGHEIWYLPNDSGGLASGEGNGESNGEQGGNDSPDGNGLTLSDQADVPADESGSISNRSSLEERWTDISNRIQVDMETFSKEQGSQAGGLMMELKAVNREKYDYLNFLRKFATLGEVMKVNDDEFDYIFYTYGLKLYENMPLIEPLEYKEVKRIKEFVIAIDTSGSTALGLVQKFLNKTYNIMMQQENFFTKINLHIIQCDAKIQEDVVITSPKDFEKYIKNLKIKGLGGTDFKPVFEYVNRLVEEKHFSNLKGLIYFTDGLGDFPQQQPPYSTAFVFVDDYYNNYDVPVWAMKLILQSEDI